MLSSFRRTFAAQLRIRGQVVSYVPHDDAENPIELTAVRGMTAFREQANRDRGARITRSADFLFDLVAFRSAVGRWPQDGDLIRVSPAQEVEGIETLTYRVTPHNGEPVYRVDPTGSQLRVHTTEFAED